MRRIQNGEGSEGMWGSQTQGQLVRDSKTWSLGKTPKHPLKANMCVMYGQQDAWGLSRLASDS